MTLTRAEFIAAYMARSEIADYSVDGERVLFDGCERLALPCQCGVDGCDGWAMVSPSGRGWHLFRDGPDEGRPTYDEAMAMDRAARP